MAGRRLVLHLTSGRSEADQQLDESQSFEICDREHDLQNDIPRAHPQRIRVLFKTLLL
jgi:hypothetical protein